MLRIINLKENLIGIISNFIIINLKIHYFYTKDLVTKRLNKLDIKNLNK